jgi:hypothetical protein
MVKMLMILHHVTLYISCIALCSCDHLFHMLGHEESKTKIQVEQVRCVFGGQQSSSCEDVNIVVIKVSPDASHQSPCPLYLNFIYNTI